MVAIHGPKRKSKQSSSTVLVSIIIGCSIVLVIISLFLYRNEWNPLSYESSSSILNPICSVSSIRTLAPEELHPVAGYRHMVSPPDGGKLTLMCCETTKGNLSVLLHHRWAPLGVARLLEMVERRYFDTKVPLFRCTDACQFGLAGDPNMTKMFDSSIVDDPMWLPPGPEYRYSKEGVRRYPPGVLTYAGGGQNSRSNQFVLTLEANQYMGGGSPWEVPLGELMGAESFDTLAKFYTGYGENGPGQGLLHREGNSERIVNEWPLLDYILSCSVVDEIEF